ncbi:MAG: hypothetical protein Q9197_005884 [Variospora fuerteventurae]
MADAPSKPPMFQIRTKSTKLTFVNPETGEALQLPPPTKEAVNRNAPSVSQSTSLNSRPSKRESEVSESGANKSVQASQPTEKPRIKSPTSATGKKAGKSNVNGILKPKPSQNQQQQLSSRRNTGALSDQFPNQAADGNKTSISQESLWKPDVYAHAYVPDAFLAVNQSPAILISSTPVQAIDYARYTSTFATPLFLPPLPPPQAPALDGTLPVHAINNLSINNYHQHLSDCLVLDLEAQVPEIRTYDMFGVQLSVIDRAQEVYTLQVPGIRENTPRVAFGDNVMVRQLIMDPATRLPLAAPATGSTGYQISAVIVGVDRPEETLNLRINGCTPHLLICNVSFIVQTRWINSLQRAVSTIAEELKISKDHASIDLSADTSPDAIVTSHEYDFGPIGTPIKSPPLKSRHDYFGSATTPLKSPTISRNDYFGAIGTPVRSPQHERQDYLGSMASPSPAGFDQVRQQRTNESNLRSRRAPRANAPIKYTNQVWLHRMLFPEESDGVPQRSLPQGVFMRSWFDRHLNHEQKKAVDAILARTYGNIPFIINGPPGTGKTKTIVETVTQLAVDPRIDGAILVCAPSDSAADTLALRLRSHFEPKVMFRLNDYSRTFAEVPQELLPYCYVQDDIFNLPPLPELMSCKIVISTCRTTDVLVQARVTNRDLVTLENNTADLLNPQLATRRRKGRMSQLHWSALLVDEAAQATEPEMLISLSVVAPPLSCDSEPNPMFVMAGDQHQLGPRIYDKSTTLKVSLFERLSDRSIYVDHPLARQNHLRSNANAPMLRPAFVNLVRNYRSHPAILAIPSALFYANTLIPEASHTDELETWPGWCGRGWPVQFVCNEGIDECEDIKIVGGGWYNVHEAKTAISCARNLLESGHIGEQEEICIMSPYRSQVNVLRKMARKAGLWGLNIGPMDAFQGLESRFVILCTTRTRCRFLEEDFIKGAGIVHEPKKFNVAITRAKQGLVVIGNPWVLDMDPHWSAFLRFCWRNGLWQNDPDEVNERMAEAKQKPANEWKAGDAPDSEIIGLENALIYKERQLAEHGSKAVRRFMSETGEDEVWRLGRLAEQALEEGDG